MFPSLPSLSGLWDRLREWLEAHITSPLSRMWNSLTGGLREVANSLSKIPSSFRAAWEGLKSRITKAFQAVLPLFSQWYEKIKREIVSWAQGAVTWVNQMKAAITSFFQGAAQFWLRVWNDARNTATLLFYYPVEFLREQVVRAVDWVTDYIIWCILAWLNKIW